MKATEILKKRLVINSAYGCDTFQIVDFEVVDDTIKLHYDSHYNDEEHIYTLTFPSREIAKMLSGDEGFRCFGGEIIRTSTYRLID